MLGAIAQFETEIRKEHQMDGIKRAQERGIHIGRKRILGPEEIKSLQETGLNGVLIKELAEEYGMHPMSIYRHLKEKV